jgi:hypothetical protein
MIIGNTTLEEFLEYRLEDEDVKDFLQREFYGLADEISKLKTENEYLEEQLLEALETLSDMSED